MRRLIVVAVLAAALLNAAPAAASPDLYVAPTHTADAAGCHGLDVWNGDQIVKTLPADDGQGSGVCGFNDWSAALHNGRLVFDWVISAPDFNGVWNDYVATWGSDGTVAGTMSLKMGSTDCAPVFTLVDRTVFMATRCPLPWPYARPHIPVFPYGPSLLATRGNPASTFLVPGLDPASDGHGDWPRFVTVGNLIVYVAGGHHKGRELWVSDGTRIGSHVLKDIRPGYDDGSRIADLVSHGTYATFTANDGHGRAAWITDGTWKGTHKVTS